MLAFRNPRWIPGSSGTKYTTSAKKDVIGFFIYISSHKLTIDM